MGSIINGQKIMTDSPKITHQRAMMSPDTANSKKIRSLQSLWNRVLGYFHHWTERLFLCTLINSLFICVRVDISLLIWNADEKFIFQVLHYTSLLILKVFAGRRREYWGRGWVGHRLRVSSSTTTHPNPASQLLEEGSGTDLGLSSMTSISSRTIGAERPAC